MTANFYAWIQRIKMDTYGYHWHTGQCCTEPTCPGTISGSVGWYHPVSYQFIFPDNVNDRSVQGG